MHIAIRNDLDQDQERILLSACDILLSACDKAWRRVTRVVVALTPVQHVHARSVVRAHLLGLVRHGERNEDRLASRGVFLICALLACPGCEYVQGHLLQQVGAQIVF